MRTPSSSLLIVVLGTCLIAWTQEQTVTSTQNGTSLDSKQQDPLKRPSHGDKRKTRINDPGKESPYKKWLNQDVKWIITPQELEAFKRLSNDEERETFVEIFWNNRDPTPDTLENEYKEEHYRRIAYANEHFSAGISGSMTDRGHIYIAWGPPDEIEAHPSGGLYNREISEGGGTTTTYPFERWRYRHLEGIGNDVILEFVDSCMCNEYRLTIDPEEKNAMQHVPGGNLNNQARPGDQFDKIRIVVEAMSPPPVKFKDLEEVVTHRIHLTGMPFNVHADFVRLTSDTVLVPLTVRLNNRDITFVNKDGVQRGTVNLFGRVSTLTGHVVQTFEDTVQVDVPADLFEKTVNNVSLYWKALPLMPNMYRLDLAVKDVNGDRVGIYGKSLRVPEYSEDRLATSSLILADIMEPVARPEVGSGNFVIGNTKIRPRVETAEGTPPLFRRSERLNVWMQVYNLAVDAKTKKSSASIEYTVTNERTGKTALSVTESSSDLVNPGEQITLQKTLATNSLEPGTYRVRIKVADAISKQEIAASARFLLE